MYGGYRYAPHHYQQPSISGVTPQAVETNSSLELIHRAKMSEFSAFKVQTSNEKAVMRFQIKNLVSLVMSGMKSDDVTTAEAEDTITEEAILAAAADSMENLAALMNKCHKKSPAPPASSADSLLPAAASPVTTTTTTIIDTCTGVPADNSAPLLPTLLEPAALISTLSLDNSRSSSSSSSAAADTPLPNDPLAAAASVSLPVLTTPATLEGGLKHGHTSCGSDNLSTRRSSLCGPVGTVPVPGPSAPEAGAGAVNPTQLVSPAGIAAAGLTVLATIEPPTAAAAAAAAAAASPTAASSGSSNDGSPRRRGKGRSRRNRNSASGTGNSGSGTGSPKAAAAVSNALKNLRSPGSAAQASSAWC